MTGPHVSILAALAVAASAGADDGYLGLRLRDLPDGHAVVSWILPGPMHGEGLTCPTHDLARPDLVVAVDGQAMSAARFKAYVRTRRPGDTVRLSYRVSNRRGGGIPDVLDHADEVRDVVVEVGSRDAWTGTIERGRAHDTVVRFEGPALLDPTDPENVLGAAVHAEGLAEPLATLRGVFVEWLEDAPDYHGLSRTRAPFRAPFRLPELADLVTAPTTGLPDDPFAGAIRLAAGNLDLAPPAENDDDTMHPVGAIAIVQHAYAAATRDAAAALGARWGDEAFAAACLELLRVPRRTFYIEGDDASGHIGVIRASMEVDFALLLRGLERLAPLAALDRLPIASRTPHPPSDALGDAVTGGVLHAERLDEGWLVIGGPDANRYDMSRVAVVIDCGGDDTYTAAGPRLGVRAIIDLDGNDAYTGTPDQGPGGALLGVSFIDDRAGDDRYAGDLLSAGAACFGMSLLLDRQGADVYTGTEWSQGAACYGAGMLVDLDRANDLYDGVFLCQGVGGPRGFGCIVDEGGRDLYRANGPEPSAYGTPAVYQSFSQGMGFGYRQYAAGGIGLISDLGGADRYEAGEFAQGGAYYFGLGILHDAAGRDLYYGNRYGQGFGVHQAHGVLVDDAGDDTYWSMTAASQGAAWDIGAGLLLDRAGNDTYQCDGLGQGGAAQQGIAMLIDLGGDDRYVAGGGATQGESGANAYHYGQTGAFSFSLLLDRGGGADTYSRGRPNGSVLATGAANAERPAQSSLHGLVIDE